MKYLSVEGLVGQYENSISNIGETVTQFIENDLEGDDNLSRCLGIQMDVAQEF